MKRHKVDIDNLPTGRVLALNTKNIIRQGMLYMDQLPGTLKNVVVCDCGNGEKLWYITHFIVEKDLLNLPEE